MYRDENEREISIATYIVFMFYTDLFLYFWENVKIG
jgi:hypothetical protein